MLYLVFCFVLFFRFFLHFKFLIHFGYYITNRIIYSIREVDPNLFLSITMERNIKIFNITGKTLTIQCIIILIKKKTGFFLQINYDKEVPNGLFNVTASECNAPNDFCPRSGFCKRNPDGVCTLGNHGECNYWKKIDLQQIYLFPNSSNKTFDQ